MYGKGDCFAFDDGGRLMIYFEALKCLFKQFSVKNNFKKHCVTTWHGPWLNIVQCGVNCH